MTILAFGRIAMLYVGGESLTSIFHAGFHLAPARWRLLLVQFEHQPDRDGFHDP
jgi:hypothetical protein